MGIWTSTTSPSAVLLDDGDYKLENGDLVPLTTSSPKYDG